MPLSVLSSKSLVATARRFRFSSLGLLVLLTACDEIDLLPANPAPIEFTAPPMLTLNPNGVTPLAATVAFSTDISSIPTIFLHDGSEARVVEFTEASSQHVLPVLGLKPNTAYTVSIGVEDANGERNAFAPQLQVVTDPLPADFPIIELLTSDPSRMEPGYTLLDFTSRGMGDGRPNWTIVVDDSADVVWYSTEGGRETHQLSDGRIAYLGDDSRVVSDFLGNREILPLQDPGAGLHHDLFETVDGTFLSLSYVLSTADNFPTSLTDPNAPTETADIQDEPVVEFAADGSVLNEWSLAELLDPTRLSYDTFFPFAVFGWDWGHSNGVLHDPSDDSIIVSLRHQEAVIKFSRATGDLIWILGPPDGWKPAFQPFLLTPVGVPFEWQYHQHAPALTPNGTLILYDNGNFRAVPFDGRTPVANADNYTRAVEYEIDEVNMQVRQIWAYGRDEGERVFAGFLGDVDWLETTGNILINHGGASFSDGVANAMIGRGAISTRVIEVTRDTPGEKVFDLAMYVPEPTSQIRAYRSERIRSLYPPNVTIN